MIGTSLLFSGSIGGLISPIDTNPPTAGYSLRNLTLSYGGDVVLVRRDSDGFFQAFKANEITNGTLSNFLTTLGSTSHAQQLAVNLEPDVSLVCSCDSGSAGVLEAQDVLYIDGFVFAWYDQSGNGYHAVQPAAASQPKIWDSITGLVTEGGKPALDFDGVDDYFNVGSIGSSASKSVFGVSLASGTVIKPQLGFMDGTEDFTPVLYISNDIVSYRHTDGTQYNADTDSGTITTDQVVYTAVLTSSLLDASINGYTASIAIAGFVFTHIRIGARGFGAWGNYFDGNQQELIIYNSDQSANRTDIENNINAYYDIYP